MEESENIYVIYMERDGEGKFYTEGTGRKTKLVCSSDKEHLEGYINVYCRPFEIQQTNYSVIDIQNLIKKKLIKKSNLEDITDCSAIGKNSLHGAHEKDFGKIPQSETPIWPHRYVTSIDFDDFSNQ